MKKLVFALIALVIINGVNAQENHRTKGRKLSIEAAVNPISNGSQSFLLYGSNLTASCGYQFNQYFYLGGTTGIYQYEKTTIPLLFDLRFYLKDSQNTPFVGLRNGTGYVLGTKTLMENVKLLNMLQLGYAFGNLTVSAYVTMDLYFKKSTNEEYVLTNNNIIQIGIGWEF